MSLKSSIDLAKTIILLDLVLPLFAWHCFYCQHMHVHYFLFKIFLLHSDFGLFKVV